jgi:hypothetical protein
MLFLWNNLISFHALPFPDVSDEPSDALDNQQDFTEEGITTTEVEVLEVDSDLAATTQLKVKLTGTSRRYHCPACSYAAAKLSNARRHLAAVHQRLRYSCTQCDYSSSKTERLRQHCETKHPLAEATTTMDLANSVQCQKRKRRKEGRVKRPPNAYVLFCQEQTGQMRAQLEQQLLAPVTSLEVTRALGHKWKALSRAERQRYQERYAGLLASYHRQKNTRDSSLDSMPASGKPLRTPFQEYTRVRYDHVRSELPAGVKSKEVFRELGRRWRTLSQDEKRPYAEACWAAKIAARVHS